ncbi:hypothetical protein [Prochlorococcus marinus]|uniref:hypothetical protein n=1 Tax=Prochlorococcus marinus TaxID=1219 RepID=UPI0022B59E8A|nr:hypothetical protein [Prochlorococcus marinus]
MPNLESYLLIKPNTGNHWCRSSVGPSFFRVVNEHTIEAFITGRDADGISQIGKAIIQQKSNGHLQLLSLDKDPIFTVGETGCFDESGVSYPWIVQNNGKEYLYYVGWVNGGKNRFQNFLGLAIKKLDHHHNSEYLRINKVPILDRTNEEPYGTGSCCVFQEGNQWKMIYTSFLPWKGESFITDSHPHSQPSYNLKIATSDDLINWKRDGTTVLKYQHGEHIHGKPVLEFSKNDYCLWFSCRGNAYQIGRAVGKSLNRLTRLDNLTFKSDFWISETQEYAFPLKLGDYKYLFFNGNGYGRTGLGYAFI